MRSQRPFRYNRAIIASTEPTKIFQPNIKGQCGITIRKTGDQRAFQKMGLRESKSRINLGQGRVDGMQVAMVYLLVPPKTLRFCKKTIWTLGKGVLTEDLQIPVPNIAIMIRLHNDRR